MFRLNGLLLLVGSLAVAASAQQRIYWIQGHGPRGSLQRAELNDPIPVPVACNDDSYSSGPSGLALDLTGARAYFGNSTLLDYTELPDADPAQCVLPSTCIDIGGTHETNHIHDVAIDSRTGIIYMTLGAASEIRRGSVGCPPLQQPEPWIGTSSSPYGVAIDECGRMIYWSEPQSSRIVRAGIDGDGSDLCVVVQRPMGESIAEIALDRRNRLIYWVSRDRADDLAGLIGRASMDDCAVPPEIPQSGDILCDGDCAGTPLESPNGIAIDAQRHRLYWTDVDYRIWTADLNDLVPHVLIDGLDEVALSMVLDLRPACCADLTGDGIVGLDDLGILLRHYGIACGAMPDDGDLDGDGNVDLTDLARLLGCFGRDCR